MKSNIDIRDDGSTPDRENEALPQSLARDLLPWLDQHAAGHEINRVDDSQLTEWKRELLDHPLQSLDDYARASMHPCEQRYTQVETGAADGTIDPALLMLHPPNLESSTVPQQQHTLFNQTDLSVAGYDPCFQSQHQPAGSGQTTVAEEAPINTSHTDEGDLMLPHFDPLYVPSAAAFTNSAAMKTEQSQRPCLLAEDSHTGSSPSYQTANEPVSRGDERDADLVPMDFPFDEDPQSAEIFLKSILEGEQEGAGSILDDWNQVLGNNLDGRRRTSEASQTAGNSHGSHVYGPQAQVGLHRLGQQSAAPTARMTAYQTGTTPARDGVQGRATQAERFTSDLPASSSHWAQFRAPIYADGPAMMETEQVAEETMLAEQTHRPRQSQPYNGWDRRVDGRGSAQSANLSWQTNLIGGNAANSYHGPSSYVPINPWLPPMMLGQQSIPTGARTSLPPSLNYGHPVYNSASSNSQAPQWPSQLYSGNIPNAAGESISAAPTLKRKRASTPRALVKRDEEQESLDDSSFEGIPSKKPKEEPKQYCAATDCHRPRRIAPPSIYCDRCDKKIRRHEAGAPRIPYVRMSYRQAFDTVYPIYNGLDHGHVPPGAMRERIDTEDEEDWIRKLLDAVNCDVSQLDSPSVFELEQQRKFNGCVEIEGGPARRPGQKDRYTAQSVSVHLRMLYREVVALHNGGRTQYPSGGNNFGYGPLNTALTFTDRLNNIVETMRRNKICVQDVVEETGVVAFVRDASRYLTRKVQNWASNNTKKTALQRTKAADEKADAVQDLGEADPSATEDPPAKEAGPRRSKARPRRKRKGDAE